MLSDLNNLKLYSLTEEQYSNHFGFSEPEVISLVAASYDLTNETNYHMLLLAWSFSLNETHDIYSNKEAGLGRLDLVLAPRNVNYDVILQNHAHIKRILKLCLVFFGKQFVCQFKLNQCHPHL